nr:hypothetical protein [Tanacetum cinerariifolium]
MFKLDLDPLAPKLLKNREAHIDYLKYTQEHELLVYVRDTCPNAINLSAKNATITPKHNVKKVRFVEPLTSSSNIEQVKSSKTSDSNIHVLSPTGLKCSTSNCGSKPRGNKRNDKISQKPSRNMKNNIESQTRKVNKKNRVVEPIREVDVKQSLLTVNSICATCYPDCSLVFRLWMFETGNRSQLMNFVSTGFLKTKDEAPETIVKCIKDIQVRLNATVHNVRTDNETEFGNQTLREFYENVSISRQTYVARTPQQNDIVKRRNQTLVEAAHTMLIFSKADPGFIMTPTTSSSGLVPHPILQQSCFPPQRDDWDHLFQPMFDEYLNPPNIVVSLVPVTAAPRAVDLADLPVSTSIDQDAPSTSIPTTQDQKHSIIISQGFEESPKTPHFHNDPFHESLHEDLNSEGLSSNVRPIHTPFESLGRWTKDHPIANVIGDPSCFVFIRKQL